MSKHSKLAGAKSDNTPYIYQKDKISISLNIRELPWTARQKEIISLFLDKNSILPLILSGYSIYIK
jgi:hypothetical protein